MISMGQGQEVPARRLMNQMMHQGGWVLLQNCHLSLDYVVELMDQIVEQDHINENFRLWVTTESHPKFPITFLQVRLILTLIYNIQTNLKLLRSTLLNTRSVITAPRSSHYE